MVLGLHDTAGQPQGFQQRKGCWPQRRAGRGISCVIGQFDTRLFQVLSESLASQATGWLRLAAQQTHEVEPYAAQSAAQKGNASSDLGPLRQHAPDRAVNSFCTYHQEDPKPGAPYTLFVHAGNMWQSQCVAIMCLRGSPL